MRIPGIACASCAFFSPNYATDGANGQCRRRAPQLVVTPDHGPRTIWPLTRAESWCGEHATVPAEEGSFDTSPAGSTQDEREG